MGNSTEEETTVRYIKNGRKTRPDLDWRQLSDGPLSSLSQAEAFAGSHLGTTTIEEHGGGYVVYAAMGC